MTAPAPNPQPPTPFLWKIFYDDGSTWSNRDGPWENAPADGVICVIVKNRESGRTVMRGSDYYHKLPDDDVAGTNDLGPYLRSLGLIKFGRWASFKHYSHVLRLALHDPDFPPKSATHPHELSDPEI